MMMKKVLIPTALDPVAREILEAHGGYAVVQIPKADILQFARENPDLHALIVRSEKVTAEILDAAPNLKAVIRAGAGYNTIDTAHARQNGVDVMNTPGANSNGVAEEVVALMLADARHLIAADASCRCGKWEKTSFMGTEITGKTIGIVGLGYIGRLVVKRLSGFEPVLLGYDPGTTPRQAEELGVKLVSLDELFATSDYVSLHLPENAATRGMVNRQLLEQMKEGATLVNCARAGIINEDDLRAIKAEKKLRFLNDVYPKDEEGPKTCTDIADIMVPHLGASTREANHKAAELAARELIELDEKGTHRAIVNKA
ncbi:MAG: 3-phosphoglycerate dehydrogenase [Kiritimatiellae bacterium]|nr:3-phosphoglycerate dehydrogenase [Kiritimatiellia bacterium]